MDVVGSYLDLEVMTLAYLAILYIPGYNKFLNVRCEFAGVGTQFWLE